MKPRSAGHLERYASQSFRFSNPLRRPTSHVGVGVIAGQEKHTLLGRFIAK